MDDVFSFGAWLRRRRIGLGLTRAELAQQASCSVATLRKLESDERRPSPQLAACLAEQLNVDPADRQMFLQCARSLVAVDHLPPSNHLPDSPLADRSIVPGPLPQPYARAERSSADRLRLTNLLAPPTPLIGREAEATAVSALLNRADVRLVTLTGTGGIGKTRLAIQVAMDLRDQFMHGVWFVGLASIQDSACVVEAIAQTLGVKERNDQSLYDNLAAYVCDRCLLLVLDNFEHVAVAAPCISQLLGAAPDLKILVTSRVKLHLCGEHEYAVPPLPLLDRRQTPSLEAVQQSAAVRLFVARSQAAQHDFALTDANVPAVVELCRRLDGLPLAIELAAARSKLFTPEALLARFDSRLALLTDGACDLPVRQQTLRNTITWSYELLSPAQQRLFARLAVFVGGWTLASLESICADDALPEVSHDLYALIEQSLVQPIRATDRQPRYMMLETIREYALERLLASGEADALRRRHADFHLLLAEVGEQRLTGPHQAAWLDRLEAEHDNLRAALQWSLTDSDHHEIGIGLVAHLFPFWSRHGYLREGRARIEGALTLTETSSDLSTLHLRAKLLVAAGVFAYLHGEVAPAAARLQEGTGLYHDLQDQHGLATALTWLGTVLMQQGKLTEARAIEEESVTLFQRLGDTWGLGMALSKLGTVALRQGDRDAALRWLEESVALLRNVGDTWGLAEALNNLAYLQQSRSNYERAIQSGDESLSLYRQLGDTYGMAKVLGTLGQIALRQGKYEHAHDLFQETLVLSRELANNGGIVRALNHLGEVARCQEDYETAAALYAESLALARHLHSTQNVAMLIHNQGHIAHHQGDYERAIALFAESLQQFHAGGNREGIMWCLEGLAGVATTIQQPLRAARLFGAAETIRAAIGAELWPADRAQHERHVAATRSQLDDGALASAWAAGQTMTLEQAVVEALELVQADSLAAETSTS